MTKKCRHCEGNEARRVNRTGFFERRVLTLLGFYPWECALCRRKRYLRNDGHKSTRPVGTSES